MVQMYNQSEEIVNELFTVGITLSTQDVEED